MTDPMLDRLLAWARGRPDIRAVLLTSTPTWTTVHLGSVDRHGR